MSKDKETFEGKSVIIFIPINLNMCLVVGAQKNCLIETTYVSVEK